MGGGDVFVALKDLLNSGSGSVDSDDEDGWININNTIWSLERPMIIMRVNL